METLFTIRPDGTCQCMACAHRCTMHAGQSGICKQRTFNGKDLLIPWNETSGLAIDPMEKKPLFHFLPGQNVLSFGLLGCNLKCQFCQNWQISQAGKDPRAYAECRNIKANDVVNLALQHSVQAIASTYNEPLISIEWAQRIFAQAKDNNIKTAIVSNGFASQEAVDFIAPSLDAANIDLKCFTEAGYKQLGGGLQPVLDTIRKLYRLGIWLEVTTLIVPGFNDSETELTQLANFIAGISHDIPWHISAFFSTYNWQSPIKRTPVESLLKAAQIGRNAGLNFVYTGNTHGAGSLESTVCPGCGRTLIERRGFTVKHNLITNEKCPECGTRIPGIF